ncbi:cupin domain-containing protein [Kriegella aquimaris]|uniref:Mannose-6-phosphate isomerase, cupin superfamily n=1 Tax=Kriegella aquimaris TaxID=192904 RepID=A0A1G9UM73_9FLAO|nr:cupin domain-containing protein [Kriegella aquimaris]SDM61040.1 Mannose-6-phosphate isomerase, cupin superfamily [Kriegella aquimaris]
MAKNWKFVKQKDMMFEEAFGRDHYWHYHPEIIKKADSYMVKVIVPEGAGHDFHVHPKMHEILYILKGRAEQWIEDEMQFLEEGDSVYIDADVVHATFNAGEGELEFLAVLSPPDGWEAGTLDVSDKEPYAGYRSRK